MVKPVSSIRSIFSTWEPEEQAKLGAGSEEGRLFHKNQSTLRYLLVGQCLEDRLSPDTPVSGALLCGLVVLAKKRGPKTRVLPIGDAVPGGLAFLGRKVVKGSLFISARSSRLSGNQHQRIVALIGRVYRARPHFRAVGTRYRAIGH
jgi:hypothetical protein